MRIIHLFTNTIKSCKIKLVNTSKQSGNSLKGFEMTKFGSKLIDAAKFVLAFIIIPQLAVLSLFAIIYTQMTTPEDLVFMQKYEEGAYVYFSMMAELIFLIILIH